MQPLYDLLRARIANLSPAALTIFMRQELPRRLAEAWCRAYAANSPNSEIVAVDQSTFTYLFDIAQERNIAAYGIMGGRNLTVRDHARMAGFPKAEGQEYHRGHMIPHSGYGGTDINLFIQRSSVNIGPFRPLERLAVTHPGSFYFVHLMFPPGSSTQRPSSLEQGLVLNTTPASFEWRPFPN